jgi:predicted acylesterase/phospholipase RssA
LFLLISLSNIIILYYQIINNTDIADSANSFDTTFLKSCLGMGACISKMAICTESIACNDKFCKCPCSCFGTRVQEDIFNNNNDNKINFNDLNITNAGDLIKYNFPFKNIVFEGGGPNGIAYAGIYGLLYDANILQKCINFAGSSIGSVFATCAAMRIPKDRIYDIALNTNFKSFKDDDPGIIRDIDRFIKEYGFYKGEILQTWVSDIFDMHTGIPMITFKQLKQKYGTTLVIPVTCLTDRRVIYFSPEFRGDTPVCKAIRMSMSIPLFFIPVIEDGKIYVDGGLTDNYAIQYFDKYNSEENYIPTNETLGLKLMTSEESRTNEIISSPVKINTILNYIENLVKYMTLIIEREHIGIGKTYWERTLRVPSENMDLTTFDLSDDIRKTAIDNAYNTGIEELKRWIVNKKF